MLFTPAPRADEPGHPRHLSRHAVAGADVSTESLLDALRDVLRDEPFVRRDRRAPDTKATLGSNAVHVSARYDERTGRSCRCRALDNLAKGASGGAVQAANVALGSTRPPG